MHHYTSSTAESLCDGSVLDDVWRKGLPQIAFEHDFLLDGLLSLTALHRASENREEQSRWMGTALEYQNRALATFKLVLPDITPELCHSAFGFSLLTLFIALALPQMDPTMDPIAHSLAQRHHVRGALAIVVPSYSTLQSGVFGPFLREKDCGKVYILISNQK